MQNQSPEITQWRVELRAAKSPAFYGAVERTIGLMSLFPTPMLHGIDELPRLIVTFHMISSTPTHKFPPWGLDIILDYIKKAQTLDTNRIL